MNALMDNFVGILTVLGIFVAVALPSLVGLAHERRVDRQLREARSRAKAHHPGRGALPPVGGGRSSRTQAFVTTTVTAHS
ncbi:hypothetical protein ABZ446_07755 [Streptomyces sp. NPDC005813]|uniref:hypothetical protein n=1 Tax=Streptomyces sp. NPDC005813 TaxID=3155592 RepID=UPI0033EE44A8